jgi:DNA-binding PadR family transcriptional regulator
MHGRHGRGQFRSFFGFGDHEHGQPWGFRRRFFEAGEVRIALLSLLKDGPKHGYELMKELEARSGGLYRASAGTVYPNLQLLEDQGLVRAEVKDDGKRVYAITDEGREELKKHGDATERIWNRASAWGDWSQAMSPGAMEVWGPLMRVMRSAIAAAGPGDQPKIEKLRATLNKTADEIDKL